MPGHYGKGKKKKPMGKKKKPMKGKKKKSMGGLTAKQKKLPPALRAAIMKKKKRGKK